MNVFLLILLATLATTGRVLGLILISVVTGWFLAYAAIKSRVFENVYIASIEVLESVPVITFFPVVLIFFIFTIGGELGAELAADFLVFTAVVWNIWVGAYQAFKTIPIEMVEITENYGLGFFSRLRYAYIPFSMPRVAANLFPSVADGFFYISVSEVITVGTTSVQTFGIGTLIDQFSASGQTGLVYASLIFIAGAVVVTVIGLRWFGRYAVAKYALDTGVPLKRRRPIRVSALMSKNPLQKLMFYRLHARRSVEARPKARRTWSRGKKELKLLPSALGVLLLALIAYGSIRVVGGVSASTWSLLIAQTPPILVSMIVDYARVALIALVSLALAVTIGYYLAVNARAEASVVPVVQALSAFPAPTYFPVLFGLTYGVVSSAFGSWTVEFYVLLLGFMSTFYYIFYSFWMGVQTIPSEFWEIMENHELGFFTRMRRIILPATFPYLIAGLSSTIDSAWGGLMIGEYWPDIIRGKTLEVNVGLMKMLDIFTYQGKIGLAAWSSLLFAIVVTIFSIFFTKKLMTIAREKYIIEEGVYAA